MFPVHDVMNFEVAAGAAWESADLVAVEYGAAGVCGNGSSGPADVDRGAAGDAGDVQCGVAEDLGGSGDGSAGACAEVPVDSLSRSLVGWSVDSHWSALSVPPARWSAGCSVAIGSSAWRGVNEYRRNTDDSCGMLSDFVSSHACTSYPAGAKRAIVTA